MDLKSLKTKFRNKTRVDIDDVDLAMKAVPFLVREIEHLENRLKESDSRINHLNGLLQKKRIPLVQKGKKRGAEWEAACDEEHNRLIIRFAGSFDYGLAKLASNVVISALSNMRKGFSTIYDISSKGTAFDKRAGFHIRKIAYSMKHQEAGTVVRVSTSESNELNRVFDSIFLKEGFTLYDTTSVKDAVTMLENVGNFLKV